MRHNFMLAVIVSLMCIVSSEADSAGWTCNFYDTSIGTNAASSDDCDPSDILLANTSYRNIAVYHENGEGGWTGTTGFYKTDMRSLMESSLGASKTWRLYLWNDTTSYPGAVNTELPWVVNGIQSLTSSKITLALTFVRAPIGIEEWNPPTDASPQLGETVLLNEHTEGNWVLWTYRTNNGLDGYIFDLTATVIPEPSSLLALFTGIAGIGGIAWRRRR